MSKAPNVPEHKLRQQANAAIVANADLRGPNGGDHMDKVAPDPVRCEASASAGADRARADRAAGRARRRAGPVARAWPFNPEDTSPLAWWRTLPSDRFHEAESLLVNATLDKIGVTSGGAFAAAMHGDEDAAIAMALSLMPIWDVTLEVDLAMTAILRGALKGDALAALVLGHVLGRADIGHPFASGLSASWYDHHLRHSRNRLRFTREEASLWAALRERDEPAAGVGGTA